MTVLRNMVVCLWVFFQLIHDFQNLFSIEVKVCGKVQLRHRQYRKHRRYSTASSSPHWNPWSESQPERAPRPSKPMLMSNIIRFYCKCVQSGTFLSLLPISIITNRGEGRGRGGEEGHPIISLKGSIRKYR